MSGALREIAAEFGFEWDDDDLKKGKQSINGAIGMVKQFASLLVANEVVGAIKAFADEFTGAANTVSDAADRVGVSAQELQALHHAAVMGGASAADMDAALQNLNKSLGADKAGPAAKALKKLGVDAKDSAGQTRSAADIMADVAQAMDGIEDPAKRARIANDLFGGSGTKLLKILKDGEGGLAAFSAEFAALGGGMSDEAIEAASQYGDAMNRWNVSMQSLKSTLAVALLPYLADFAAWIGKMVAVFSKLVQGTYVVQMVLIALGTVAAAVGLKMLAAWIPALAPILAAVVAVLALIVVFDDLIGMIKGNDSALGRFLDKTYGIGTQQRTVSGLTEAWDGFKLAMSDLGTYLGEAWQGVKLAFTNLWTWITDLAGKISNPFTQAWNAIDTALGGALGRMWEKVRAFFRPVTEMLSGIGRAASGGLSGIGGAIASIPGSIAKDWKELVLNVQPTTPAPAGATTTVPATQRQATPTRSGGPVSVTNSRNVGPTTVNVSGVGNPEQVARRVVDLMSERERTQHDADHPLEHAE